MAVKFLTSQDGRVLLSRSGKYLVKPAGGSYHPTNSSNSYLLPLNTLNTEWASVEVHDYDDPVFDFWFSADFNLQIIYNDMHFGYNTLYLDSSGTHYIEFYDYNLYDDQIYGSYIQGDGEFEAEYIRQNGRLVATLQINNLEW